MTGRRLQRRYRGVYQRYSFITHLVTWLIIITVVVFAALDSGVALLLYFDYQLQKSHGRSSVATASDRERMSRSNDIVYLATIVLVLYILVQLALIVRWIIYWIILAMLLTYAITGTSYVLFWIDGADVTDADRHVGYVMLIVLAAVEGITIAAYWFTHFAYPWLVSHQKFDLESWWNIKPGVETNTLTYLSKARFYKRERSVIRYCGGLNARNQPHGYGMWTDTSYHGERLTGQWKDGNPVGPFRSFEHGSGYSFVNLRVGFCHNRAEKSPTEAFFFPNHSENGLNWGVASAECSVSGGFFKYLPAVTYLTLLDEDKAPQSATECLSVLRTPTDSVVFSHHDDAMGRSQHYERRATRRHLLSEKSAPVLDISRHDEDNCKEALVMLHGYSCALDYAIQRLAQLLALGDFPSYIHPFVFSWPSGGVLAYYQAKEIGSEGERTAHDFILFLQSLTDAGYTKLNIIAHSMGARVFFSSLNKGLFDQVLLPTGSNCNVNVTLNKLELSTLTLCNPDYERNEFVKYGGGYDRARHFCSHITLYADSMDGALFYSEFLLKKSIASPLNYSLGRRGHMVHRDLDDDESTNRSDPLFPIWQTKDLSPPQDLDRAYAAVNQRANYAGLASFAYNRSRAQSTDAESTPYGTPRSGSRTQAASVHYLDMDVIDTTWMDNNVHAIRHNYFNLNPTIVDDLRHLIVYKNRASCRPGLLKTTSAENVYIFLVAPSHVKNK